MPHAGEFITSPISNLPIRTRSPSGIGFSNGAGGAVTQLTSKSTGVTLDSACGRITMHGANLAAGAAVSFTWTNSYVLSPDVISWSQRDGTDGAYAIAFKPSAGSVLVTLRNLTAGALAEAVQFNFAITKGAVS